MVRFIIKRYISASIYIIYIYIPIWLDLLLEYLINAGADINNLHSNMVRFIIPEVITMITSIIAFTFQYG